MLLALLYVLGWVFIYALIAWCVLGVFYGLWALSYLLITLATTALSRLRSNSGS